MQIDIQTYKDLGQALREVRTSLRLDPRDVAQQLHIRAKYLTALEEGEIDVMPGKVYARGYLRQYAEFLGLNADEMTEAFDRVTTGGRNVRYFVPEPTSRNYQPGALLVVIALVAVSMVYFYWYRTHHAVLVQPGEDMVPPVPERLLAPVVAPDAETAAPIPETMGPEAFIGPMPLPETTDTPKIEVEAEPEAKTPPAKPVEELPWRKNEEKAAQQ